jgi:peptidoglycan/xylan/chitin deacetylase (PgdA/CDA1 family)
VTEPQVVSSAPAAGRAIALTFDDGPSGSTEDVLEILDAHQARGTFFVVGHWVERLPHIVRAIAERGHEVGNHTWTHFDASEVPDEELWRDELRRTSETIAATAGRAPALFRPPYGHEPERFAAVAAECGLGTTVLWSVDPEDWESNEDDALIEATVVAEAHPGAIVLHHDGDRRDELNSGSPQAGTVRALPRILERLSGEGYSFVTVSELLAAA